MLIVKITFQLNLFLLFQSKVEAALQTDETNSELLKLKHDLQEVIGLTRDLIKQQLGEQKRSSYVEPSTSSRPPAKSIPDDESYADDVEATLLATERMVQGSRTWKLGDKCQVEKKNSKWL